MNEQSYRDAEAAFWNTIGRTPTESYIRLPRIGTDVRIQEVGEGEPVVFVHGGINAGSTFVPMLANLHGYRCLLVDRPGVALSRPFRLEPTDLPQFGARFVGDVLDGLGIGRAHVVASSFGGHLALRSAAAEPERITRMVLLSCPALVPGETLPPFLRGFRFGPLRWLVSTLPPNRRVGRVIFRQMGHGATLSTRDLPPGFWEWSEALQRETDTMRSETAWLGGVIAGVRSGLPLVLDPELFGRVMVPSLFLWGADDRFGGPVVGRRIAAAIPDAHQIDISDAGHLPWLDFPKLVGEATRQYLDGEDPEAIEHWMSSGVRSR